MSILQAAFVTAMFGMVCAENQPPVTRDAAAATSCEQADALSRYYFHQGFYGGSLRSEVPLPVYDPNPEHLWNRLFAAFYIRKLKPYRDRSWPDGPPAQGVDEEVPKELSAALRALWRQTYNTDPSRRIEGGDVIEPSLFPHADSLLFDRYFELANSLLQEFVGSHGEQLIEEPLKRVMLQRDLWHVFDLLQKIALPEKGSPAHEVLVSRKQSLSQKVAAVIQAVSLNDEGIASLPDNYELAILSGRFAAEHRFVGERPYLPPHLPNGKGDWVEIDQQGQRPEDPLIHTGVFGFEGRAWFRVFCRFPAAAGGREAVIRFLCDQKNFPRDAKGGLSVPDVPVGTEVALVRVLLAIDRDGEIRPTRIVEQVQLRVLKYLDGEQHPDSDSGRGQNFYQYELRRALLFDGLRYGGLRRLSNDTPHYFFSAMPVSTFASLPRSPEKPGDVRPLGQTCAICHRHENVPYRTVRNVDQPWPKGYPFGKGSIRTMLPRRPSVVSADESGILVQRVIEWKKAQKSFQQLTRYMGNAR